MNKLMQGLGLFVLRLMMWFINLNILLKVYDLCVVHQFPAMPHITVWQLWGVQLFAQMLTLSSAEIGFKHESNEISDKVSRMLVHTLALLISWGIAHIVFG